MPARQFQLIRLMLVLGVATFAALATYQRMRQPVSAEQLAMLPLGTMRYALYGLAVAALLAALFLKSRLDEAPPARRDMMVVVGWAFGEGVALFGTVQHYLGAPLVTMMIGLLSFLVVLILLPVPRPAHTPA